MGKEEYQELPNKGQKGNTILRYFQELFVLSLDRAVALVLGLNSVETLEDLSMRIAETLKIKM